MVVIQRPYLIPPPEDKQTTSIILITNLVPKCPDISMTVGVLDSALNISKDSHLLHLYGLSDTDSRWVKTYKYAANTEPNRERLQKYISNLRKNYLPK